MFNILNYISIQVLITLYLYLYYQRWNILLSSKPNFSTRQHHPSTNSVHPCNTAARTFKRCWKFGSNKQIVCYSCDSPLTPPQMRLITLKLKSKNGRFKNRTRAQTTIVQTPLKRNKSVVKNKLRYV